jgi:predicted deacylase
MELGETAFMDWRVKTFESQANAAFAFLLDQGFIASAQSAPDVHRRPAIVAVRFISADATVETALSLGFAGEDGIYTTVLTTEGSSEFGPSVAHKGHEMRKALHAQADQVRHFLHGH